MNLRTGLQAGGAIECPPGDYLKTCKNVFCDIVGDGQWIGIHAHCPDEKGQLQATDMYLPQTYQGPITAQRGYLVQSQPLVW